MNKSYPQEILDDALRMIIPLCLGGCKRLNKQKILISSNIYNELESRFTHQFNQALELWNNVHDSRVHEEISLWVEQELIIGNPPIILKKLHEINSIIPDLLQDYEKKYWEFRTKFFATRLKPMFTIEIEIYAFKKFLKDKPSVANQILDKIKFSIENKMNIDYSGKGGWLNDTDTYRFRFETNPLENVYNAACFSVQKLRKLKIKGLFPEDLTILVAIGYGEEFELISGLRLGSSVNDARDVIDSKINDVAGNRISIGKVKRGQVVCFLSELSYNELSKILQEEKVLSYACTLMKGEEKEDKIIYEILI